jgi:acetyltransferase-like isoleucine patch superfamily enzyme
MAAAVINSGAILGSHGIVNTGALLDHDVRTGDFVSIAPGVTIGGHVSIDRFSAVGIGAVVVHNIRIGENSVVGAGALVLDDIGCDIVAYGTPCRPVRVRRFGDPYL